MVVELPEEIRNYIFDYVYGEKKKLFDKVLKEFDLVKHYYKNNLKFSYFDGNKLRGTLRIHRACTLKCEYCKYLLSGSSNF